MTIQEAGTTYFAHSIAGETDRSKWEPLTQHLENVAQKAKQFADNFDSAEWGYLAGLWHDLGKYRPEFQRRLRGEPIEAEHSGVGAALAVSKGNHGTGIAFAIAGHHAGLANPRTSGQGFPAPLIERICNNQPILESIHSAIPPDITEKTLPELPIWLREKPDKHSVEFWIRFLYSTLVDADWLETEAFVDSKKANARSGYATIAELQIALDAYIDNKVSALYPEASSTKVNCARAEILAACRRSASMPRGIFSLTAPTGGGKTLASMSFALRHAKEHKLRRIIVVIPFTSIVEQNAREYGRAMGEQNVLEHHSNLDLGAAEQHVGSEDFQRHTLATENWDAPIIVTTTVQFFESLLSNRRGQCRKLHNIARSVIVLDEVQTLPPEFLSPILSVLRELQAHYGCSIVLSTATPPALRQRPSLTQGLEEVREILDDPLELSKKLTRVTYEWRINEPATWQGLAAEAADLPQALVVVHKRDDARVLAQAVMQHRSKEAVFHLSALMCASHRLRVLDEVRRHLKEGLPCVLISTQLVEAGVDLDFPVVYRALGGLDGIVQAAGRCNREGRAERGNVVIFQAPTTPPSGTPKKGLEAAKSMWMEHGNALDLTNPEIFETYFCKLYHASTLDAKNIQGNRREFNFATVGQDFKLIEDGYTHPIVVPYGKAPELSAAVRRDGPTRESLRALQPYLVQIYPQQFEELHRHGAIEELVPRLHALTTPFAEAYNDRFGLLPLDEVQLNPAALYV